MDVSGGVFRVRRWPSPRPTRPTKAQAEAREKFRLVQRYVQYQAPDMQIQVRQAVQGTPLLPRDLLTSMMYNRLLYIVGTDGRKMYPMPARIDVSNSLDVLSQLPGSVLFRGTEFWEALGPGDPGQILAIGADGIPFWATVEPEVTAGAQTINTLGNTNSAAFTNLATIGPTVTILTGASALVELSCITQNGAGGAANTAYMGFDVSGVSAIAASDANATQCSDNRGGFNCPMSRQVRIDGLTPGVNTFTAKYHTNGQNFNFFNRTLSVQPI